MHGANRLGGNSLLDGVLFGRRAGRGGGGVGASPLRRHIPAAALAEVEAEIKGLVGREGGERHAAIRAGLQKVMTDKVGIYRDKQGLQEAIAGIASAQGALRAASSCRTRADSSTPTCCRRWRPATCSTSPSASPSAPANARRAAAAMRASTFPSATTRHGCKHSMYAHAPDGPVCDYAPVAHHALHARGAELLMRATLEVASGSTSHGRGGARPAAAYEVELPDGSTVLEALMKVQDEQDGTL